MPDTIDEGEEARREGPPIHRRLAWFFGIAAASGLALAAAAETLRWLLLH